jgi:replicative DNA helicase
MEEATKLEDMAVYLMTDLTSLKRMYSLGLRESYFEEIQNKKAFAFSVEYWQGSNLKKAPTCSLLEKEVPSLHVKSTDVSATYIVEALKKRLISNRMKRALLDSADSLKEHPKEALEILSNQLWSISKQAKDRKNVSELYDTVESRKERYHKRSEMSKNGIMGASIGFPEIDQVTMGLANGELCTIAAPTKTGKTWIGLKIVAEAMKAKKRAVFFTLELSVADIEDRLDAILSGVSYARLSTGTLSSIEVGKLSKIQQSYDSYGQVLISKPRIGERTVPDMMKVIRDFDAELVVIDQLSFMEASNPGTSKTENASRIIDELKMSVSEDEDSMIPVYLLSQMNRAASFTENGRGKLTNIALTSNIENASDLIIGLGATKEQRINNTMVVEILGSRRTSMRSWLIYRNLQDKTDFHVIKEMTDDEDASEEGES